jgi:hypothetical protein
LFIGADRALRQLDAGRGVTAPPSNQRNGPSFWEAEAEAAIPHRTQISGKSPGGLNKVPSETLVPNLFRVQWLILKW